MTQSGGEPSPPKGRERPVAAVRDTTSQQRLCSVLGQLALAAGIMVCAASQSFARTQLHHCGVRLAGAADYRIKEPPPRRWPETSHRRQAASGEVSSAAAY